MNIEVLTLSRKLIQKKIRHYRDELIYNKNDDAFVKSRRDKIFKLRIISRELLALIKRLKNTNEEQFFTKPFKK